MNYNSWGNYPIAHPSSIRHIYWRDQEVAFNEMGNSFLCYAQGKSYGDVCLNENGILLDTKKLNRFISFDSQKGIVRCEAGITFSEILRIIVPQGWFLPVVPGTQFISLGGAIANDIHGKNHHQAGAFGRYVKCFELLKSNGTRLLCSSEHNSDLYKATIGGLGLTGLITWAEIELKSIKNSYLNVEYIKFNHINDFFQLNKSSEKHFTYTVAWLDCASDGRALGRGIFMRANHNEQEISLPSSRRSFSIPCYFPNFFLNRYSIKAFNGLYYHKHKSIKNALLHYQFFFFQLDAIHNWNRIYGKRGFLQYQCIVPEDKSIINDLLKRIVKSNQGSFLSVLKTFGTVDSPGFLSFPKQGVTLAFDFPNRGQKTLSLLAELDVIVMKNNGRVYPAKDARMSSEAFKSYYPNWADFLKHKDIKFNSNFWRRVAE